MTADQLVDRVLNGGSLVFEGDEVQALCDVFEHELHQQSTIGWRQTREAKRIVARTLPLTWLDETPAVWLGEALGCEWLAEF